MKRPLAGLTMSLVVFCLVRNSIGDTSSAVLVESVVPKLVLPDSQPAEEEKADEHKSKPDEVDRPMFSIDVGKVSYFTVNYSQDGGQLATAANRKELLILDATTGKPIRRVNMPSDIISARFAPDGKHLMVTGRMGVRVLDRATGKEVCALGRGGHTRCDFSPSGHVMIVGTMKGATLWETKKWQQIGELTSQKRGWYCSVSFRADGKRLATCSRLEPVVRIWDTEKWDEVASFDMEKAPVYTATYAPLGSKLAATNMSHVKVWDVGTGKELYSLARQNPYTVAFSADGKLLATADRNHSISIRNAQNGHELFKLNGHQSTILSVAFHSNGKHLASASRDGTVKVWEWTTSSSSDSN